MFIQKVVETLLQGVPICIGIPHPAFSVAKLQLFAESCAILSEKYVILHLKC